MFMLCRAARSTPVTMVHELITRLPGAHANDFLDMCEFELTKRLDGRDLAHDMLDVLVCDSGK